MEKGQVDGGGADLANRSSTEELERHGMGHSMIAKYDEISNVK